MSERFFLLAFLIFVFNCEILCNKRSLAGEAIGIVIESYFVKNSMNFDVISCNGKLSNEGDVIEEVARNNLSSVKILRGSVLDIVQSAIIICDSIISIRKFNEEVSLSNKSPKVLNFLVLVKNTTTEDINRLSSNTSNILRFQSFLVERKKSFELKAFSWFTERKCGARQMVELNRFSKETRTWKYSGFFSAEIRNFHGCELTIGVLYPAQPSSDVYWTDLTESSFKVWGYNVEIVEALKSNLNFKIDFRPVKVADINSAAKIFDYVMVTYSLNPFHSRPYYTTSTFVETKWIILVPPGENYSGFEKLFLPFSFETWICFVGLILTALIVIFIIKMLSKSIQIFVFGLNVNTPILNLMIAFFGGGQMILPGRNFARFILTLYIIFSLIMRTAYQGILFELLQSEPHRKEIQSIEEMIENNYSLYYKSGGAFDMISEMDLIPRSLLKPIESLRIYEYMDKHVLSASFKGGVLVDSEMLDIRVELAKSNLWKTLDEKVLSANCGMVFKINHPLFESFNAKITQMISSGLTNHLLEPYQKGRMRNIQTLESGPQVLTMLHLMIGFEIWVFFLLISISVFLLEHFCFRVRKLFRK